MSWRFYEIRNATARLDLKRALKAKKSCIRCGCDLIGMGQRKYCSPCSADALEESKRRNYEKRKAGA